jgi:hypothetical protein
MPYEQTKFILVNLKKKLNYGNELLMPTLLPTGNTKAAMIRHPVCLT